uniref:Uncharacterized protein n=1 Tax=uncultured bacterium contig00033 TaxID=1181522 RepID=A0A806K0B2_9BACT|nr:hypothetical protein [uncultured bacterium contig00033]
MPGVYPRVGFSRDKIRLAKMIVGFYKGPRVKENRVDVPIAKNSR